MNRVDTRESRIDTLKKTQESRKQNCLERVYKAIERLQKIGAKINFHTVAKEAGSPKDVRIEKTTLTH